MKYSTEEKIDNLINAYLEKDFFSGAVLVSKSNKIILCKGYGLADVENNIKNTPDTEFLIASITKLFTAVSIMILNERKLLDVKDTIDQYLPKYANGDKITIHHLLTHTAGIPNLTDDSRYIDVLDKDNSIEKIIELFENSSLECEPGEKFLYSNLGYTILAYIIEVVSKQSLEKFLQENIFEKLNMVDTGFAKLQDASLMRSVGYMLEDRKKPCRENINMNNTVGWGNLYSTVTDLYKLLTGLYSCKLTNKASLDKMRNSYYEGEEFDSGYGFKLKKGLEYLEGWIFGYCSLAGKHIERDYIAIILSNCEVASINIIMDGIDRIFMNKSCKVPQKFAAISIDESTLDDYTGVYKDANNNASFEILKERETLYIAYKEVARDLKIRLIPTTINNKKTRFYSEVFDIYIDFRRNKNSRVISAYTYRETYRDRYEKTEYL